MYMCANIWQCADIIMRRNANVLIVGEVIWVPHEHKSTYGGYVVIKYLAKSCHTFSMKKRKK